MSKLSNCNNLTMKKKLSNSKKEKKRKQILVEEDEEQIQRASKISRINEESNTTEVEEVKEADDNSPWANLQLILSLQNKEIHIKTKLELAHLYVQSRIKEEITDNNQASGMVNISRVIIFLNNWVQSLLIASEKKLKPKENNKEFEISGSCFDYSSWVIFKFCLEESLKHNISLSFPRDLLQVIHSIVDASLSNQSLKSDEELKRLCEIVTHCVSLVFSSHGGISNENLDLWVSIISSVLELVQKILHEDVLNEVLLQLSCYLLEGFAKFLRVHPVRKNSFRDFINKLLTPLLHLLDVLRSNRNDLGPKSNLLKLIEEVISQGLFHPTHIDGFLSLRSTLRYKDSKDGLVVLKSYHKHLFDEVEKIISENNVQALGGIGELLHLLFNSIKKQKGEINAEIRKSVFDFFVQIMEFFVTKIDVYLVTELNNGPILVEIHCLIRSVNYVLASLIREKIYVRAEDISEGASINFLKMVYNKIMLLSTKVNDFWVSSLGSNERKLWEVLLLIAKEIIITVHYLLDTEYETLGDDLESLWALLLSYKAHTRLLMDFPAQSLLNSEILKLGCRIIDLYSELRQVNTSIFSLCKALRLLVPEAQTLSHSSDSFAYSLSMFLCSPEVKHSISKSIQSIPEGQASACIRNLTSDISESLEWVKTESNFREELLGRGLSELYSLILSSITVTFGNSNLIGVSMKELMEIIRPHLSLLLMSKTFTNEWILVFSFRLYASFRSFYREVISVMPPKTSRKISGLMGDHLTAYSGLDWVEKSSFIDEGYFSWIIQPSIPLHDVLYSISDVLFKDTVINHSSLIYVSCTMSIQRLVDLNRLIKSIEYLIQLNDYLGKKSKKFEKCVSNLRNEAENLTSFLMKYLWLLLPEESFNESNVQAWNLSIGSMDDKSLLSALWWIICQNIDIWCIHASKKDLKKYLSHLISSINVNKPSNQKKVTVHEISLQLLSDTIFYEQEFVRKYMATRFCRFLEKSVSSIFGEIDLTSKPNWEEVINALENPSSIILGNKSLENIEKDTEFSIWESLLSYLILMPKGHLSSKSFKLYVTTILNLERLMVGSLVNSNSNLCFRLFVSCRRALKNLMTSSMEDSRSSLSSFIVETPFLISWLVKSLSVVIDLQVEEDKITPVMDQTSSLLFLISKNQFECAINSLNLDEEDTDAWRNMVIMSETIKDHMHNTFASVKKTFLTSPSTHELKKLSASISSCQGFLWGLASGIDKIDSKDSKFAKKISGFIHEINTCINACVEFINYFMRVLFFEDDHLSTKHDFSKVEDVLMEDSETEIQIKSRPKNADFSALLIEIENEQKCAKKSVLQGLLTGQNIESAIFLRQILLSSSAIFRLNLQLNQTSSSWISLPCLFSISETLVLEFVRDFHIPNALSFILLDSAVKFIEQMGSYFPLTNPFLSKDLYTNLIDLHLRALGKCITLQGKQAILASQERESSRMMLEREIYGVEEFKTMLRSSFIVFVNQSLELHLRAAILAIERAVIGVQNGCMVNYEIQMGSFHGGKVSMTVSSGIDCLDLILEHATGKKRIKEVNKHIEILVASLFNIILHMQGPNIFSYNKSQTDPDSGSMVLMCTDIITRVFGKYALFKMEACHVAQSLRVPSALFQNLFQLQINAKSFIVDRQFSIQLYSACCRLLCTVLKHHKRETQKCFALLEHSVSVLLGCLEMVNMDHSVFAWEVEEAVKCASFLRRVYEEIRQHKDVFGNNCFQLLSSYIWVYCGFGPLKLGIRREIDEALRPGIYALIDACSADDFQHLHTVFGEGPCRSTLANLQHDHTVNFQYQGKV